MRRLLIAALVLALMAASVQAQETDAGQATPTPAETCAADATPVGAPPLAVIQDM